MLIKVFPSFFLAFLPSFQPSSTHEEMPQKLKCFHSFFLFVRNPALIGATHIVSQAQGTDSMETETKELHILNQICFFSRQISKFGNKNMPYSEKSCISPKYFVK